MYVKRYKSRRTRQSKRNLRAGRPVVLTPASTGSTMPALHGSRHRKVATTVEVIDPVHGSAIGKLTILTRPTKNPLKDDGKQQLKNKPIVTSMN